MEWLIIRPYSGYNINKNIVAEQAPPSSCYISCVNMDNGINQKL